jgi:hypothetical protein
MVVAALALLSGAVFAQSGEGGPVEQPLQPQQETPLSVTGAEPPSVTSGQNNTISVFGANFTNSSVVRLVGFGLLETTFINGNALTAVVPGSVGPGTYTINVSDPANGEAVAPTQLTVNAPFVPTATFTTAPTFSPPTPTNTLAPPTPVPGQPSLVVRNFTSIPSGVAPGGSVVISFEIVNQGNRTAEGVSVSLDSGGKFVPAAGQASATLPNLPPGASYGVSLNVIAAMDAAAGPNTLPISMQYRDFEGKTYESSATLSVTVEEVSLAPQLTIARTMLDPNPVEPGQPVTLTLLVTNTGNKTASQVLVRVGGENGVLLPGAQGDSIPLGDLEAGESESVQVPMIVGTEAEAGPQAQPVTITFLQEGEAQTTNTSVTIPVARAVEEVPVVLLDSYDIGEEFLTPGQRFTLDLTLNNVGNADARDVLVVFGTVDAPTTGGDGGDGGNGGSGGSGGGTGGNSGGGTTVQNSSGFAPLGAGSTLFFSTLASGETLTFEQEFIASGTLRSGIYNLPVTVRFTAPDGETEQSNLRASIVVIAPPRLTSDLAQPLPETVNTGEPFPFGFNLVNMGTGNINLTRAVFSAENAEIVDGADQTLAALRTERDLAIGAMIMPLEEGPVTLKAEIYYLDDLNNERVIVKEYEVEAVQPPPPPEMPDFEIPQTPVEETSEDDNFIGRLLMGFLGLGG